VNPNTTPENHLQTLLGHITTLPDGWDASEGGFDDPAKAAEHGCYCPLTVVCNANPLFVDYVPHNPGVFSLHDDLSWPGAAAGQTTSATVSYSILGFFARDVAALQQSGSTATSDHLAVPTKLRVCWGQLSNVVYQRDQAPPEKQIKAAAKASFFYETQPMAVGEDILDAYLAHLQGSANETEAALANIVRDLNADFALKETNAQLDRADISSSNFKPSHGGFH